MIGDTIISHDGITVGMARKMAIKRIGDRLREKGAISRKSTVMPYGTGLTAKHELVGLENLVREGKIGRTKEWHDMVERITSYFQFHNGAHP